MTVNVAINGFGRIGRCFLRALLHQHDDEIRLVGVNDLADPKTLAYLLRYDSVRGPLEPLVSAGVDKLDVGGLSVSAFAERDPARLPWRALDVDVVIESTGAFTDGTMARAHLTAGARKVIITAPATHEDVTIAYGINNHAYDADQHD